MQRKTSTALAFSSVFLLAASAAGRASTNAEQTWLRVVPDLQSSQQVDVTSVVAHKDGWAAWTRTSHIARSHLPEGVAVPTGSHLHVRMHVTCGQWSADVRFLESRVVDPAGGPGADAFPPAGGIPYGHNTVSMVCAAATAKCNHDELEWPVPEKSTLYFIPSCKTR